MYRLVSGRESPYTPRLLTYLAWGHRSILAKGHNQTILKTMLEKHAIYVSHGLGFPVYILI